MQSADPAAGTGPVEAAFGAAADRFGQLLQAILREIPAAAAGPGAPQRLNQRLAAEFERWLREPGSMPPWWQAFAQGSGLGSAMMQSASAVGDHGDQAQAYQRMAFLAPRWSQLHIQLTTHWHAFARDAGEKFLARAALPPAALELNQIRQLYDLWIDCAEQAYANIVHSDNFCRTRAELINITTELLLLQRSQAECVARILGMPTRSEVDQLREQLRRMQHGERARAAPGKSRTHGPRRSKR